MKKFIFLDIDGVLNLNSQYGSPAKSHYDDFVERFDRKSLHFLYLIWLNTGPGTEIILSAACRKIREYRERVFSFFLETYGIPMDKWTMSAYDGFRGSEVNEFLSYQGENGKDYRYAILDDESDFYLEQRPFLFQTDPEYGITKNIAYRVEYLLNHGFKDERRLRDVK